MMRKTGKRLICFILAVCTMLTFALTATAAETKSSANDIVGTISICTRMSGFPSMGHTWVYIENTSNHSYQLGLYELPPKQGVSLGTFCFTRSDGFGLYYNIEAHCGNKYGLSSTAYCTRNITASDVTKISNKLMQSNFWDPLVFNCVGFAASIWNMATGDTIVPLVFPVFAQAQILSKNGSHKGTFTMYYPPADRVYKHVGVGANARLKVASAGSLDSQVG